MFIILDIPLASKYTSTGSHLYFETKVMSFLRRQESIKKQLSTPCHSCLSRNDKNRNPSKYEQYFVWEVIMEKSKRRWKINPIEEDNPQWHDLAEDWFE